MLGRLGKRGYDRGGSGARADDQDSFAGIVDFGIPELSMDEKPLVLIAARPVWDVGLFVVVVPLAHPEKVAGETHRRTVLLAHGLDPPMLVLARPAAADDSVAVTNVFVDAVLFDHLTHVLENLFGTGDRGTNPGFEAIAERVQIRVGPHARVLVGFPGTAERVFHLEDGVGLTGALILQMVGGADSGDSRADDQDVDMLRRSGPGCCLSVGLRTHHVRTPV